MTVNQGCIILLNGTSSSGKSAILRALQDLFDPPLLDAGIDKFLWMLPSRYLEGPLWQEIYHYQWSDEDPPLPLSITPAPLGNRLISGMHHAIAALARAGNNLVADHVLTEPGWLQECARLFSDLPAWFIGVRCPLEIAEQRERERENRTLGWARAHHDLVHSHGVYDLEVDTSLISSTECALLIRDLLQSQARPQAFRRLHQASSATPPALPPV